MNVENSWKWPGLPGMREMKREFIQETMVHDMKFLDTYGRVGFEDSAAGGKCKHILQL